MPKTFYTFKSSGGASASGSVALNGTTLISGTFQPEGAAAIDLRALSAGYAMTVDYPSSDSSPVVTVQFNPVAGAPNVILNVLELSVNSNGAVSDQGWVFGAFYAGSGLSIACAGHGAWIPDTPANPLAPPSEFRVLK